MGMVSLVCTSSLGRCAIADIGRSSRLIASALEIYVEMSFRRIIIYVCVIDHNRVYAVVRVFNPQDGMEYGRVAVDRLEVGLVVFFHAHGVRRGRCLVVYLEKVSIFVALVTHGQQETVHVHVAVDEHRVVAIGDVCGYGERVGEGGHGSGQLVGCEHAVVERAVDGGTRRQQTDAHDDERDYFPHFISSSI